MLQRVFTILDQEITELNVRSRAEGMTEIPRFYIKVVGQTALLEAQMGLPLFATVDVDAYANFVWLARECFCRVLEREGRHFDELSDQIWMPPETQYRLMIQGVSFDGYLAEPEYVLISKALKAPKKNGPLIRDYLALRPSPLFFALAETYKLNLEQFL